MFLAAPNLSWMHLAARLLVLRLEFLRAHVTAVGEVLRDEAMDPHRHCAMHHR
jgi:uncharacterized protein (DUF934 family)